MAEITRNTYLHTYAAFCAVLLICTYAKTICKAPILRKVMQEF